MVVLVPRQGKKCHYFSGHMLKYTKTGRRKNNNKNKNKNKQTYISVNFAGYAYIIHLNQGLEKQLHDFSGNKNTHSMINQPSSESRKI